MSASSASTWEPRTSSGLTSSASSRSPSRTASVGHRGDGVGDGVQVGLLGAARAVEQPRAAQAAQRLQDLVAVDGEHAEGGVAQDLDPDAAEADGEHLAPGRVGDDADQQLDPAGALRLDQRALHVGAGRAPGRDHVGVRGRGPRPRCRSPTLTPPMSLLCSIPSAASLTTTG